LRFWRPFIPRLHTTDALFKGRQCRHYVRLSVSFIFRIWIGAAILLAAPSGMVRADSTQPDLTLHGMFTGKDNHTYRLVSFTVPSGVTRITVQFEYTGREEHTTLDLGLFDPNGFRGWSGGNKSVFTVSPSDATPSYLPGAIIPGEWQLIVGVPNIRTDSISWFTATIYFSRSGRVADEPSILMPVLRQEAAWYRGDLHSHTAHSDANCQSQSGKYAPCPLFLSAEAAVRRRLDFLAITDHNTTSHFSEIRELQPYFDRLLLIPGREITTFQGHANLYGTTDFTDFRVGGDSIPAWNVFLQKLPARDVLLSVNHPSRPTGEACMGCGWHPDPDVDWHLIHVIEAVNGDDTDGPMSGIDFWQRRLNLGLHITAIGGGDNHNSLAAIPGPPSIGYPSTVVHAPQLSTPAILEAIRAGHVFIDVSGTSDRLLEFTAESEAGQAKMGDTLHLSKGAETSFGIHVSHATDGHIEVIQDGELTSVLQTSELNQPDQFFSFAWKSDGRRHWLRINVRGPNGKLWLVGNPIFINFD